MYDDTDPEPATEELLEGALAAALRDLDLAGACTDSGLPVLTGANDDPIEVTKVHTFEQVGMLTLDRGVYLELSDGSAYALTIGVSRRPASATQLRSHKARIRDARRHR